jgi:hypothetical protein
MEVSMKRSDAFQSKYFKAADLESGPLTRVIEDVDFEVMNDGAKKPVARFCAETRGLVLNGTNYDTLANIARTDDTDAWTGLKIQLYASSASFAGKTVPAIRIKAAPLKSVPPDDAEDPGAGMGPPF